LASYDSRTAALVLGLGAKEIDNILSRQRIPGVTAHAQGVDRRIGTDAILRLATARELRELLGCPWERALALAGQLEQTTEIRSPSGHVAIRLDQSGLRSTLSERLIEATELVVRPPRGRPRSKARRMPASGPPS
jgi:hypothetical protein